MSPAPERLTVYWVEETWDQYRNNCSRTQSSLHQCRQNYTESNEEPRSLLKFLVANLKRGPNIGTTLLCVYPTTLRHNGFMPFLFSSKLLAMVCLHSEMVTDRFQEGDVIIAR